MCLQYRLDYESFMHLYFRLKRDDQNVRGLA